MTQQTIVSGAEPAHAHGHQLGRAILHRLRLAATDRRRVVAVALSVLVLAVALGRMLYQWIDSDLPFRSVGAPEEQVLNFVTAEAFVRHGFFERGFLTDYSIDPDAGAPAVYYTHFPPLPSVIMGGLIRLGIDDLASVRLLMILVTAAGLAVVLGFLWRHFTPWHGIAAVAFFAFDDHGVLPWADHVVFAYWLALTFGALWGLTHARGRTKALWFGLVAVFLTSLINYVELVALSVALVGLWVVRFPNVTWRRVVAAGVAGGGGIGLHLLQNAIVLGPEVATRDILYTVGNRVFAEPTRESILEFSQQHDLVLWGASALSNPGVRFAWIPAELDFYGWSILGAIVALGVLSVVLRRRSAFLALRLGAVLGATGVSWHLIFQAHGQAYPLALLIGHPANVFFGLAAGEALAALLDGRRRAPEPVAAISTALASPAARWLLPARRRPAARLAVAGLVALAAVVMTVQIAREHVEAARVLLPSGAAGELEVLRDFRDEPFWTNVTPHLVSYYTKDWVVGQLPFEAVQRWEPELAFVTTVSRRSRTWDQLKQPHYFFFSEHNRVLNLPSLDQVDEYRRYLEERFPVVAWSEWGSKVFDLSLGPIGDTIVVPASADFDLFGHVRIDASSTPEPAPQRPAGVATGPALRFDLQQPQPVSVVRVRPRHQTFPHGITMQLEGSADGQAWQSLALLSTRVGAAGGEWLTFPTLLPVPHRYYRLTLLRVGPDAVEQIELYSSRRISGAP